MKKIKNILIQFAISFMVLWSVLVWYAALNDVVSDGASLTHTMWNDLVTQVWTISSSPVLQWYIRWLTISNDVLDVNNDIQIDVGTATSSDGFCILIYLLQWRRGSIPVGRLEIILVDWQQVQKDQILGIMYF